MSLPRGSALRRVVVGLGVLGTLTVAGTVVAARPAAPKLLPDNTVLMLSVVDCPDLAKRFLNTALGRMSQDPQVSPLVQHVYGSLGELVASVRDRMGLSLPEILAIPQGEWTFALVAPEEQTPVGVMLLDTGSQLANARALWQRATEALEKSGARKSEQTLSGTVVAVYDGVGPQQRQVIFFEKDATLVLATSLDVAQTILTRWSGNTEKSLSQNPAYAAVMRRCRAGQTEEPQVIWYVDPIGLLRAIGQASGGVRVLVALLPTLGLDGIQGLGGTYLFDAGPFDSVVQMHLLLENPRSGALDVLAFQPTEVAPEPWVPNDVVGYTALRWNFKLSYKALQKVIDSVRGEGTVAGEIKRRLEDPLGVDFAGEILPSLEGRVVYLNWIERPVTPFSQATLVGFKLQDPAPIRKALERAQSKYPDSLSRQMASGQEYCQVTTPRRSRNPDAPPLPRPCFAVFRDYFIYTDRASLFEKIVGTAEHPEESLAGALDYKLVASKLVRQAGGKKPALIGFSRPEESMRFLYELAVSDAARQNLQRQAERNPFFKSLQAGLEAHPLPPFEVIQRYFAPGGVLLIDDETGLHYTAFTLRRK